MAPPVSGAELGGAPARREKVSTSVVPAVPRVLERRRELQEVPQSTASSSSSSRIQDSVVDSSSSTQSDLNELRPEQAQATLPSTFFQAHNLSEASSSSDHSDRTQGVSSTSADAPLRTPLFFGELPSRHLPLQTPSSSGTSLGSSRPPTSSTSGQAPRSSSLLANPQIVFGRDSSSPETSPTLTPSATSTSDTHPTPMSDLTAQVAYRGQVHATPSYQPPPVQPLVPSTVNASSLLDLSEHLVAHFKHGVGTDVKMVFVDRNGNETCILGHFVVLTRSPRLAKALADHSSEQSAQDTTSASLRSAQPATDHQGRKLVRIYYDHPEIDREALRVGIEALYGADSEAIVRNYGLTTGQALPAALAMVAVGTLLENDDLIHAGSETVVAKLSLDSVEQVLESIFAESIRDPERRDQHGNPNDGNLAPAYSTILAGAISLLVSWVPPHFDLDRTAAPVLLLGGLPAKCDNPDSAPVAMPTRPSPASPDAVGGSSSSSGRSGRSGRIQFGALPPAPEPRLATVSRVLLSAPAPALEPLLRALGNPGLAQRVVAEREARRRAFLAGFAETAWGALQLVPPRACWRESLRAGPGGEIAMEREPVDPALV